MLQNLGRLCSKIRSSSASILVEILLLDLEVRSNSALDLGLEQLCFKISINSTSGFGAALI